MIFPLLQNTPPTALARPALSNNLHLVFIQNVHGTYLGRFIQSMFAAVHVRHELELSTAVHFICFSLIFSFVISPILFLSLKLIEGQTHLSCFPETEWK